MLANRAVELAGTARQPHAELWGHVWLVDAALQAGDLGELDRRAGTDRAVRGGAAARGGVVAPAPVAAPRGRRWSGSCGERGSATRPRGPWPSGSGPRPPRACTTRSSRGWRNSKAVSTKRRRGRRSRCSTRSATFRWPVSTCRLLHALLGETEQARATFDEFRAMPATVEVAPDVGAAGSPDRGGRLPARRRQGPPGCLQQTVHVGTGLRRRTAPVRCSATPPRPTCSGISR